MFRRKSIDSKWILLMMPLMAMAFDSDWSIQPHQDSPRMELDNGFPDVVFRYDIPHLYPKKTVQVSLFQNDCELKTEDESLFFTSIFTERELEVEVRVVVDTVMESPFWTFQDDIIGTIDFCIRVDVLLESESVNFHETVSNRTTLTAGTKGSAT
eukprot:scaffold3576_cov170-Amphora_coffeaeformis.AAC.20